MIEIKAGVRLHGIRPELVLAVHIAEGLWMAAGAPSLVITACIEGQHTAASDHYSGCAVDFRTKNLPEGKAETMRAALMTALGDDFFVLHENAGLANDHVHLSFRPKNPY